MNNVSLVGRLTRDVDAKYTTDGKAVSTFSIAIKNPFKPDNPEYVNIVVWGKTAEFCNQYLSKGRLVSVNGRLQTSSWDDKDSGKKVYKTEVVADTVQGLDRAQESTPVAPAVDNAPPADGDMDYDPFRDDD
jgi:single-strand DNA-binding protein